MNDRIDTLQWQRLGMLFEQAIGLDTAAQAELLRSIENEDAELAKALASMLTADARHHERTVEQRERVLQGSLAAVESPDVDIGDRVGPYLLREGLGRGGMGVVFLAERADGQVRQEVALKVIKLGMDTREVIARFEAERQALAMMEHPHIARMLDAGATASGRPYFVMELVRGEPISGYCSRLALTIPQRLRLFDQVCAAVQHAHTKGVIHRDLKPSNVLVSSQDGQPFAKVIDFGIAKATSGRLTDKTLLTEQFGMMGTPLYMSPEQAAGSADIDTRTDIYALGVILYELLTDSTPLDSTSLRTAAPIEVQRIIREVDPPRPSVRLSQSITTGPGAAAKAGTDPRLLVRTVRGELDWIVMKAIEKDRTRRYESAGALAQDVRRYLAGEAVLAAPPRAGYRMRKFVRRNKGTVAAGSLIAASLLAGIVAFAWQAQIAREQAQLAERRAREVEQVAQFEGDMLKQVDPSVAGKQLMDDIQAKLAAALAKTGLPASERTGQLAAFSGLLQHVNATDTARDLIDRTTLKPAVAAIDKQFGNQPVVAATLDQVLAYRYQDMGLYDEAIPPQKRALAIRRRVLGDDHPDTLQSINSLGALLFDQGKTSEAEPYYREALDRRRRVLGPEHPDTLESIANMGGLLFQEGKLEQAEPYLRDAVRLRRRVLGEDNPDTLVTINNLGVLLRDEGKLGEAETFLREALEHRRRVLGEDNPGTLGSIKNLGGLLMSEGKYREAEPYVREALERSRRVLGEENPKTLISVGQLGELLVAQARYPEAESLLSTNEAATRNIFQGGNQYRLALLLMRLGRARLGLGEFAAAQANLLEARSDLVRFRGPTDRFTLECTRDLVDLYTAWNSKEPGKGYDARLADWKNDLDAPAAARTVVAAPKPSPVVRQ